jgi:hypothetical protein
MTDGLPEGARRSPFGAGRRPLADAEAISEGTGPRSLVAEFGPIGCLLAPLVALVIWLWRRSRSNR